MRTWLTVAAAVAALGLLGGCGSGSSTPATTVLSTDANSVISRLTGTWQQAAVSSDSGLTFTPQTGGPTLNFNGDLLFSDGASNSGTWSYSATAATLTLTYTAGTLARSTAVSGVKWNTASEAVFVTNSNGVATNNQVKWVKTATVNTTGADPALIGTWTETQVSTDGGVTYSSKTGPSLTFDPDGLFSDGTGSSGTWTWASATKIITLTYTAGLLSGQTSTFGAKLTGTTVLELNTVTGGVATANFTKYTK